MKYVLMLAAVAIAACCLVQEVDAKDVVKTRTRSTSSAVNAPQMQVQSAYQSQAQITPRIDYGVSAPVPVYRDVVPTPTQMANSTFQRARTRTNFGPPNTNRMNYYYLPQQNQLRGYGDSVSSTRCQCGCNQENCNCGRSPGYAIPATKSSNDGKYPSGAALNYAGPRAYTEGMTMQEHLHRDHGYSQYALTLYSPQQLENIHSYEHANGR